MSSFTNNENAPVGSIPTNTIYHTISAPASVEIVQEVANLFDKFPASKLAALLREMIVLHSSCVTMQRDEINASTTLIQFVYDLETTLRFSSQQQA